MKFYAAVACLVSVMNVLCPTAHADHGASDGHWKPALPESHAPIGVMGDHTHAAGETMLSYRYMQMDMDGNRSGTDRVSTGEVLQNYMVAPTDMKMHMHMLGVMWAPGDTLTLMGMLPFVDISMNHLTRMGGRFKTKSSGIGDVKLSGLVKVYDENDQRIHLNLGLSTPTGGINERGDTPVMSNAKLPYPMQLGSGTWDVLPGISYLGQHERVSWGAQVLGTVRLGENDNDYTLGDRFESTTWLAYGLNDWLSASTRALYSNWGNIDGADPELNPMMVPTANPDLRGGERLDLGLGLNAYLGSGPLKGFRIAAELLLPAYQDLDGPTLETDMTFILGVQKSFPARG